MSVSPVTDHDALGARRAGLPWRAAKAEAFLERVHPRLQNDQADAVRRVMQQNRSRLSRWRVMLRLVDDFDRAVAPIAACKPGCSHCCHIPVEMTELEAEQLGHAFGRRPNTTHRYASTDSDSFGYDTPCPFLAGSGCSIYADRPMACRKNHNLDVDALFCRLDLPAEFRAGVLRIQSNAVLVMYASCIAPGMKVGDIRDWFPGQRDLDRGPQGAIPTARQLLTQQQVIA